MNIGTARIKGLEVSPTVWSERFCFIWNLMFTETSTLLFNNISFIPMGDDEETAMKFYNRVKKNFKRAHINENEKVAIIFDEGGTVKAVAKTGRNSWIDIEDKFSIKTFQELNIQFNALKVY